MNFRQFTGAAILSAVAISTLLISNEHVFESRPTFTVEFSRGERMSDDAPVVINQVVNALTDHRDTHARIVGFSGAGEDPDADMALSMARADDVSAAIAMRGIDASRLIAMGRGAASGGPQARVEITVSH